MKRRLKFLNAFNSPLIEAERVAEIHLNCHNVLNDELSREIKEWQKVNYPKSIVNTLKIPKEYEEEFKKVNLINFFSIGPVL